MKHPLVESLCEEIARLLPQKREGKSFMGHLYLDNDLVFKLTNLHLNYLCSLNKEPKEVARLEFCDWLIEFFVKDQVKK